MRELLIASTLCIAGISSAAQFQLTADLNGLQETPPVNTDAFGTFSAILDTSTNTITVMNFFTVQIGAITGSHIHQAPVGQAGPIVLDFSTFGSWNGQGFEPTGPASISSSLAQDLAVNASSYYVNVHSVMFPSGEIRGQLRAEPVPEPVGSVILGLGLTALMALRRRS